MPFNNQYYYVCKRNDFNIQVLKKFVGLHEFKSKNLVEALRWIWLELLLAIEW